LCIRFLAHMDWGIRSKEQHIVIALTEQGIIQMPVKIPPLPSWLIN
jgi:hypothetical protein